MLISMNREEFCFWREDEIKKSAIYPKCKNEKARNQVPLFAQFETMCVAKHTRLESKNARKIRNRTACAPEMFAKHSSRSFSIADFASSKARHEENSPATAEKSKLPSNFSHHRAAEVLHANETKVL